MGETMREWLEHREPEEIERVGGACVWETKSQYGDAWSQMLGWLGPILDAPIVRCGDRSVVLAVDREELEGEALRVAGDANEEMVLAILDAILAKLDFREVDLAQLRRLQLALEATEVFGSADADACREIVMWVRDTFGPAAKPKSAQASKEGE